MSVLQSRSHAAQAGLALALARVPPAWACGLGGGGKASPIPRGVAAVRSRSGPMVRRRTDGRRMCFHLNGNFEFQSRHPN